jgi:choline transport protein
LLIINSRVSIIAPPSCAKFLSYLTGWMTIISWQAGLAGAAFLGGTMIQGLIVLNHESYDFQRWHGTLLFYAVIFVSLFINTYLARILPSIESTILLIHILGFFAVGITLVYLAPHKSAKEVFATFGNSAGWSSDGLSFFVGLSTSMFSFIGKGFQVHCRTQTLKKNLF